MPLDLSVLYSKDPTGRKAEAIRRGGKVRAAEYEDVIEASSKILGNKDDNDEQHHVYYTVKKKSLEEKEVDQKAQADRRQMRIGDVKTFKRKLEERKNAEEEKTAKRRAKRAKRANK